MATKKRDVFRLSKCLLVGILSCIDGMPFQQCVEELDLDGIGSVRVEGESYRNDDSIGTHFGGAVKEHPAVVARVQCRCPNAA